MWHFLPMLLFGILLLLLLFASSITFGLGLLILAPVYVLTPYTSYRLVFRED